jgi:uncharacterized membrane protein YeiB
MNVYDRYDFALSIVVGLIMVGILMLGGPIWALALIMFVTIFSSVYRHTPEVRPFRRRGRSRST